MPEVIGWLIAAVLLVSSGHGFRCWYRQFRDKDDDIDIRFTRVQDGESRWLRVTHDVKTGEYTQYESTGEKVWDDELEAFVIAWKTVSSYMRADRR